MKSIAKTLAALSGTGCLSLLRARTPARAALLIRKVVAAALAPYVALTSPVSAIPRSNRQP